MKKMMKIKKKESIVLLTLLLFLAALPALSVDAGELKGRVVSKEAGPAIVWIEGLSGPAPSKKDTVITHASGGSFAPAVNVGFVGNDFVFRNEDETLHTTHLYLALAYQKEMSARPLQNGATLYNIALPIKGMEVRRPIKTYHGYRDETGFITVKCNPHPEEEAFLAVFDHPYATVSSQDGSFSIPEVPAGKHEVWVWANGKAQKWGSVDVSAGATDVVIEVGD